MSALRSAAFLTRSFIAEALTRVASRVRPRDRSEWLDAVVRDHVETTANVRPGHVTLSPEAERMRADGATEPETREDEHAPPPPLRGSLEWREKYGDRR